MGTYYVPNVILAMDLLIQSGRDPTKPALSVQELLHLRTDWVLKRLFAVCKSKVAKRSSMSKSLLTRKTQQTYLNTHTTHAHTMHHSTHVCPCSTSMHSAMHICAHSSHNMPTYKHKPITCAITCTHTCAQTLIFMHAHTYTRAL